MMNIASLNSDQQALSELNEKISNAKNGSDRGRQGFWRQASPFSEQKVQA